MSFEVPYEETAVMASVKFCNEITLGNKNGFENNVKSITQYLIVVEADNIIILPQKDVVKRVVVPMTNVASYYLID